MTRVALLLIALCSVARADQPTDRPEAFEVDRDRTPPGQAELGFDAGAPIEGWAASAQVSYLDRPFNLHTSQRENYPVEHRETLVLGGVMAVGANAIVDLRIPMSHQVGDRLVGLGDNTPLDHWVIGDVGLGGRLRLAQRERAALFARAELTLPSGDDHDFAGDARFTGAWMLIARFTIPQGVMIAATAGVRFRPREVRIADRLLGDELFGGIGVTYELPGLRGLWCPENHVRVTGELDGILGNDVAGQRGPSPAEVRLGMVSEIRPWLAIGGHIGKGITNSQIGSPRARALVEVVYRR
jgi:hypothetical protein